MPMENVGGRSFEPEDNVNQNVAWVVEAYSQICMLVQIHDIWLATNLRGSPLQNISTL